MHQVRVCLAGQMRKRLNALLDGVATERHHFMSPVLTDVTTSAGLMKCDLNRPLI